MKLVNDRHLGGAIFLLLLVVLSQARLFDLFLKSSVGRGFFLLVMLSISYFNKILGIVGIFIFIIIFSLQHRTSIEGMDSGDMDAGDMDASDMDAGDKTKRKTPSIKKIIDKKQKKYKNESDTGSVASSVDTSTQSADGFTPIERFDLLGNESTLQRGKRSNCISVEKSTSGNVQPSESITKDNNTMVYSKF